LNPSRPHPGALLRSGLREGEGVVPHERRPPVNDKEAIEFIRAYHQAGLDAARARGEELFARPNRPRYIHYSELAEADPASTLGVEHNTYRREVARLLEEGHEGKYILIKGEEILGIWEKQEDALNAGYDRFLGQPFMVRPIQTWERLYYQVTRYM